MIDPKELRIGNLVLTNGILNEIAVTDFMQMRHDELHAHLIKSAVSYDPIPITPEWLERVGIEKDEKGVYEIQIGNNSSLYYDPSLTGYECGVKYEWSSNHAHDFSLWGNPKYIHQLQNLFFALTGSELTVKETTETK